VATLPLAGDAASTGLGFHPDVAAPAAIVHADGTVDVFVRGLNSELVQRTWGSSGWGGWKNLGGTISSAPTVTSSLPGRLDLFARGGGDDLVYRVFQKGRWGGWINLGGTLTSAPSAVSPAPGRIEVFVRGASGELVQRSFQVGKPWSGWKNLGDTMASAPAAVALGTGRIDVFARSPDFRLIQRSYRSGRWRGRNVLGGDLSSGPAVTATGPDSVHVFVRGLNGELVHRIRTGTSWSGWKNVGGTFTSAPAAATDGGRIEVFLRGTADNLVQRTYVGGLWSDWKNLGGSLRGKLRARLRILTHNVYGLDGNLCAARARELGWQVAHAQPAYDIVAVQEYYNVSDFDTKTCDAGPLSDSIWSTGRYRNGDNYYRWYPDFDARPDGGIGVFSLHSITFVRGWRWDNDRQAYPRAPEGFLFARIRISSDLTLDTFIVHLNSNGDDSETEARERRRLQLLQLRRTIADVAPESGNPVLVLGDFNIGGPPSRYGNSGYADIQSVLEDSDDLWMQAWPRSDGWTYDCVANSLASGCSDDAERIDYILAPTEPALTSSRRVITIARRSDVKIVRWRTVRERLTDLERVLAGDNPPPVSDHWGLEATIEIRDR
jgi:endonuclease/exonuclease/phosphatase family metal-dependent hydrolase